MAANYPGLPEELMPIGVVIMIARAHDARSAALLADFAGVRGKPPGQALGLAAALAVGVTR
jgi:hypothetical protein